MDGAINQGGAVSNTRSWLDQKPGLTHEQAAEISAERIDMYQSNRIKGEGYR